MNLIDPDRHQYWNSDIRKHLCCEKLFTKKKRFKEAMRKI